MVRYLSVAVVGIDFGHSRVGVAVADIGHNVLAERRCDLDVSHDARAALDAAARMVDEVLGEARVERKSVIGAGIGIPGPLDRARGTAGSATILPGWIGVRIGSEMHARLDMPVEIANDPNPGPLARPTRPPRPHAPHFLHLQVP